MAQQEALKAKGIAAVYVYCVNDGAVMTGWAKDQGIEGSMITFLADTTCAFTRAVGMVLDHPGPMGALGTPRFATAALTARETSRSTRVAFCDTPT